MNGWMDRSDTSIITPPSSPSSSSSSSSSHHHALNGIPHRPAGVVLSARPLPGLRSHPGWSWDGSMCYPHCSLWRGHWSVLPTTGSTVCTAASSTPMKYFLMIIIIIIIIAVYVYVVIIIISVCVCRSAQCCSVTAVAAPTSPLHMSTCMERPTIPSEASRCCWMGGGN